MRQRTGKGEKGWRDRKRKIQRGWRTLKQRECNYEAEING